VLLKWAKQSLRRPITRAVATYFHRDRTGGIPALQAAGIPTVAHPLTCELARSRGTAIPTAVATLSKDWRDSQENVTCSFRAQATRATTLWSGSRAREFCSVDVFSNRSRVRTLATWRMLLLPIGPVAHNACARDIPSVITVPGHGTISGDPVGHSLALLVKEPAKTAA
jgi:hypothetical protein